MKKVFHDFFEAEHEVMELVKGLQEISRQAKHYPALLSATKEWGDLNAAYLHALRFDAICSDPLRGDKDNRIVDNVLEMLALASCDLCAVAKKEPAVGLMVEKTFENDCPAVVSRRVQNVTSYVFRNMI